MKCLHQPGYLLSKRIGHRRTFFVLCRTTLIPIQSTGTADNDHFHGSSFYWYLAAGASFFLYYSGQAVHYLLSGKQPPARREKKTAHRLTGADTPMSAKLFCKCT